jgi:hypothetical protein
MEVVYAVPTVAGGSRALTVKAVGGAMTMDSEAEVTCEGFPASLTEAVKLNMPLAVGVPEMTPVPGAMLSPVGRPETTDQM